MNKINNRRLLNLRTFANNNRLPLSTSPKEVKSLYNKNVYLPKLNVHKNLDKNISKALDGFSKKPAAVKSLTKSKDSAVSSAIIRAGKELYTIAMKAKGAIEKVIALLSKEPRLEPIFGAFFSKLLGFPGLLMHAAEGLISGEAISFTQFFKDLSAYKKELLSAVKGIEKKLGKKLIPKLVGKTLSSVVPFLGIGINFYFGVKEFINYKRIDNEIVKNLYKYASIFNGIAVGSGLGSLATTASVAGIELTPVLKTVEGICSFIGATLDIIASESKRIIQEDKNKKK